ncbi:MAG: hypothetical protein BGO98_00135 [Myxococcales bacterium 68-20]|nr:hypothetical protein [Myxococcales bacterium]OJY17349.1 MAG: hypothetical protein BGO98_00135 [Myxococcales bacterium 68-20]
MKTVLEKSVLGALLVSALVLFSACSSNDDISATDADAGADANASTDGDDGGVKPSPDAGNDAAATECGRLTTKCPLGAACDGPLDCASGACREGVCHQVSPANGVKDGDETDVDCGGANAPACADGKACLAPADCQSSVCTGNQCQAPTATDGVKNGTETDIDCGGGAPTNAPRCQTGDACAMTSDCAAVRCNAQNKCAAPAFDDGIKNGTETDIDCGGGARTRCATGKGCLVTGDCDNVLCNAGTLVCDPPTSGDGIKNGTETDIDCGGGAPTNAPRCDGTKKCAAATDCKSGGCNHVGVCAFGRSCTMRSGGTTCGTGDTTKANQHEDCCASAVVPVYNRDGYNNTTEFRLDKYQITTGRIRRFLDAVGGNVKGWVQANRASILAPNQLPAALDPYLPAGFTQPNSTDTCSSEGATYPCNYGALNHVNGFRYNNNPGGDSGYGCYMSPDGYGSRTFFTTAAEDAAAGIGESRVNGVSRERAEEKAMSCATYYILAAFCAWDGGRLETIDEYNAAYGGTASSGRIYPWDATAYNQTPPASRPIGFVDLRSPSVAPRNNYGYTPPTDDYSVFNAALTAAQRDTLLLRVDRANLQWNYFNRMVLDYRAPLLGAATMAVAAESGVTIANDQSAAVAPPGRYPAGEGVYGHRDLLGNVMEITAQPGTADVGGNRPWTRNGSFETSHFNADTMRGNAYSFNPLTKYGRTGGRCARPISGYLANPLP